MSTGSETRVLGYCLAIGFLAVLLPWAYRSRSILMCDTSTLSTTSPSSFFTGGRMGSWMAVGMSLFTCVAPTTLVTRLPATATSVGIVSTYAEVMLVVGGLVLAYLLLPLFLRSRMVTLPSFVFGRFRSSALRLYVSVLCVTILALFRVGAMTYYAVQYAVHTLGWSHTFVSWLVVLSAFLAVLDGVNGARRLLLWNGSTLVFTLAVLVPLTWMTVRGWDTLVSAASHASEAANAGFEPRFMHFFRGSGEFSPLNALVGGALLSLWSFGFDPSATQYAVSARSSLDAKAGVVLAMLLVTLTPFALGLSGTAARLVFPKQLVCSRVHDCWNAADTVALIFYKWLPDGFFFALALFAGVATYVSSLVSTFTSSAAIVALDVTTTLRCCPADEKRSVLTGRLWIVLAAIATLVWTSKAEASSARTIDALFHAPMLFGAPLAAVLVVGVLWPRLTGSGVLCGLLVANVAAGLRTVGVLAAASDLKGLLFSANPVSMGIVLAAAAVLVAVIVSMCTSPQDPETIVDFVSRSALRCLSSCNESYVSTLALTNLRSTIDPMGVDGLYGPDDSLHDRVDIELSGFSRVATQDKDDDGSDSDGAAALHIRNALGEDDDDDDDDDDFGLEAMEAKKSQSGLYADDDDDDGSGSEVSFRSSSTTKHQEDPHALHRQHVGRQAALVHGAAILTTLIYVGILIYIR